MFGFWSELRSQLCCIPVKSKLKSTSWTPGTVIHTDTSHPRRRRLCPAVPASGRGAPSGLHCRGEDDFTAVDRGEWNGRWNWPVIGVKLWIFTTIPWVSPKNPPGNGVMLGPGEKMTCEQKLAWMWWIGIEGPLGSWKSSLPKKQVTW